MQREKIPLPRVLPEDAAVGNKWGKGLGRFCVGRNEVGERTECFSNDLWRW